MSDQNPPVGEESVNKEAEETEQNVASETNVNEESLTAGQDGAETTESAPVNADADEGASTAPTEETVTAGNEDAGEPVSEAPVEAAETSAETEQNEAPVAEASAETEQNEAPVAEASGEAEKTEVTEVEGATVDGASLLPKNDNPKLKWYVVHTYSGYEQKAKLSLAERAKLLKMEHRIGEVIIPQQVTEKVLKSGKKKQSTKTSFPGYIIVQLDLDDDVIGMVKATPRITGFIGNQKRPRALPDDEVLRLTNPEAAKAQAKPTTDVRFSKGEGVKVKEGPFSEFDGVIDEVKPDKAKLRVLVSIFGRETPVELDYNQVEKL